MARSPRRPRKMKRSPPCGSRFRPFLNLQGQSLHAAAHVGVAGRDPDPDVPIGIGIKSAAPSRSPRSHAEALRADPNLCAVHLHENRADFGLAPASNGADVSSTHHPREARARSPACAPHDAICRSSSCRHPRAAPPPRPRLPAAFNRRQYLSALLVTPTTASLGARDQCHPCPCCAASLARMENLAAQTPPAGHIEQGGPRRRDT